MTLLPPRYRTLTGAASLMLLATLAAGWAGDPAVAQAPAGSPTAADRTADIDRIFGWAKPDAPGCAIALSQNGKVIASRAYGSADLGRNAPITTDSVFDIGSTHKQFVAAAILLLAEDGKLKLSDNVRKHIPELPDYGKPVTIDHLLTHTSGIRDWTALLPMASDKPTALAAILRQTGVNFVAGEEWSYSNSNYVLLKEIVARVSKEPFADFAAKRLFAPLGMKSSLYSVDMLDAGPNRALAYEKQGDAWKISMRTENDRGGGGILSSVGDLLIWNDALVTGKLGASVTAKLHEPATLNNGRKLQYARGLLIDAYRGTKQIWHSGGSAGYSAWLGRYPEYGLSVAALCNSDGNSQLARRVADLYLPATLPKPQGPPPPNDGPPDPLLTARAGLFVSEAGDTLRFVVDRGRFRVAAGPPLLPSGESSYRAPSADPFFLSQDEFEIRFVSNDELDLRSMEGKATRYRRAEPWTPSEADLRSFAGRYESTDLKAVFVIASTPNGLTATVEHDPKTTAPIRPAFRDTFQIQNMTFRFQRDSAGKVTGLAYSNPVLKAVPLKKLG